MKTKHSSGAAKRRSGCSAKLSAVIGIRSSNWANRSLVLDFGDGGVPKSMQRADTATLTAAAAGINAAATALQTSYSESLDKLAEIQTKRRTVAQSDLLDKIARANQEKALIDARVSLEGATATRDLLVQQEIAKQKLASLQDELALQKEAQSHDSALEIEQLKSRLAVIEQQLLLLRGSEEA